MNTIIHNPRKYKNEHHQQILGETYEKDSQ